MLGHEVAGMFIADQIRVELRAPSRVSQLFPRVDEEPEVTVKLPSRRDGTLARVLMPSGWCERRRPGSIVHPDGTFSPDPQFVPGKTTTTITIGAPRVR